MAEKVRKVTPFPTLGASAYGIKLAPFTTLAADALCMWPAVVRAPATATATQKAKRARVRLMAPSPPLDR